MPANRIFYASQAVGLRHNQGSSEFMRIHGLQSVGVNTNFNLDAAYQLGNIDLYANIEGTPEVEVTLEKLLDGRPLILDMATATGANSVATSGVFAGQTNKTLVQRSSPRTDLLISVADDSIGFVSTSGSPNGVPLAQCLISGAYLSQISYKIPVDGNASESATIVGNTKVWTSGAGSFTLTPVQADPLFRVGNAAASGVDYGIVRRQHVDVTGSTWPKQIPGVNASNGKVTGITSVSGFTTHFQNVNISCQLGRESLMELGRKMPYFRFVKFPVEVTSEFEVLLGGSANQNGDFINATEAGVDGSGSNLRYETIVIDVKDAAGTITRFDLGTKNMLTTVNYQGGGVDGSNASATYSYRNFNNLTVSGSTTV
jgi:hypothetical protein